MSEYFFQPSIQLEYHTLHSWLETYPHDGLIVTDHSFGQYQLQQHLKSIRYTGPSPLILTYNQWIHLLFKQHPSRSGRLLSHLEAYWVFSSTLKHQSDHAEHERAYRQLSRHQALPWQSMWKIAETELEKHLTVYRSKLTQLNQYDTQMAFEFLLQHPSEYTWHSILIACTQPLTLPETKCIKAHTMHPCKLMQTRLDQSVSTYSYKDVMQTTWGLCEHLHAHRRNAPQDTHAIVCNQYEMIETLHQALYETTDTTDFKCVIALPQILLKYPIIQTAIALLKSYLSNDIDLNEWLSFFQQHHLTVSTHHNEHINLIHALKKIQKKQYAWDDFNPPSIPALEPIFSRLMTCKNLINTSKTKQSLEEWGHLFSRLLSEFNWPGPWENPKLTQGLIQAWQRCWSNWKSLDAYQPDWTASEALFWLEHSTQQHSFKPKEAFEPSNIFIIHAKELSTGDYDHIWVMQADQTDWPYPRQLLPCIPHDVKKQHALPCTDHETHDRHITHAHRMLLHAGQFIHIFHTEDIEPLSLEQQDLQHLSAPPHQPERLLKSNQFEYTLVPEAASIDLKKISSNILKDTSQCYFKSISKHYLNLSKNTYWSTGYSHAFRGMLIHDTLALIWSELKHQAALLALSTTSLDELIEQSFRHAFKAFKSQNSWPLNSFQTDIEITIIQQRLKDALELDKKRSNFEVIGIEHPVQMMLKGQLISMRLDRLDQTESGVVIIDYKTGVSTPNEWFSKRPDNPQMPLYALAYPELVGLLYLQIKPNGAQYTGLLKNQSNWSGLLNSKAYQSIDSWEDMLEEWKSNLIQLIEETQALPPLLNPKHGALTCRQCEFKSLCRIQEKEVPHDAT